ncbi:1,4-alpha-glucan branching protein GlgB [Hoyosella sp. YIM 151337]|uniref:1,4-alpha-glucan branching protein GlgB n=1 Tax=Hoyosella sp. YIM 151337 TaxID=2992742 RepID=UPI002235B869|nr:1,4-alpha-glucan branching protein GlgB [Hoyosella sp. YIM 151337]MCW4355442.1 1,4-alpha-glucan branching protein GlgB [Hoyosella sp. YIM 151337]
MSPKPEIPSVTSHRPASEEVHALAMGSHSNPHVILGAHEHESGRSVVRVYRPEAASVAVVQDGQRYPLERGDEGLFSGFAGKTVGDYKLEVTYHGHTSTLDDPYRWLPTLGELDLHLISEGRHERLWDVLGARPTSYDTPSGVVNGVAFSVWAPNARGVRVCGDFDGWSGVEHSMRSLGSSGVWELFVPGIGPGTKYKFRIHGADGGWHEKADPMAVCAEHPPATASVIYQSAYEWTDNAWSAQRASSHPVTSPISIYEVHLGSWRPGLGYREAAEELADYVSDMGFTHVEFLPLAEHPFGGSWGYQVTSYYAPTSRFGSPDDLRYFIDTLHNRGIGVILDWVPAHFPRDIWALAKFDGSALYEHPDPRRGEQPDWGTYVFDFGRPEVRNFLVANALYWFSEFHIDGLRVDAVASMLYLDYSRKEGEWIPNERGGRENLDAVRFLQELNATVYKHHPGVLMIAEESTSWPGVTKPTDADGLGFGFKWNMGWMNDTLLYMGRDPVHRSYHHNDITFSLVYAWSENFILPLSHDEVVHGKGSLFTRMPGDHWKKAAGVRALLAYMWAHPGKQLLFMGGEFGQQREWSHEGSVDWHLLDDPLHSGIKDLVAHINRTYRSHRALYAGDNSPEGFTWIDANDAGRSVLSFIRFDPVSPDSQPVVCIANFSGTPHHDVRVGLPRAGRWREAVNTDATDYGGSGVGNMGAVEATSEEWNGQPASAVVQVPPLGVLWLIPE